MQLVADAWTAFFHTPEPATTLAVFRCLFGTLLVINAAVLTKDLAFLYGPDGAMAHCHRLNPPPRWLAWLVSGQRIRACLAVHVLAAICLTIGWLTPVAAGVAFVTLRAIQTRNPLVTYGGDDVLRVMTFLLIFSRAGDALSLDHWLEARDWRSSRSASPWCLRVMQLQVSVIYFKAFLAKVRGGTWRDGRAILFAVEVEDFQRRRLPAWARRPLWCRLTSGATLAVEAALGPLVWISSLRPAVVIAGIAMHLAMEWFLNLYLFGPVMIACLLLFIDPYTMERWLTAVGVL